MSKTIVEEIKKFSFDKICIPQKINTQKIPVSLMLLIPRIHSLIIKNKLHKML